MKPKKSQGHDPKPGETRRLRMYLETSSQAEDDDSLPSTVDYVDNDDDDDDDESRSPETVDRRVEVMKALIFCLSSPPTTPDKTACQETCQETGQETGQETFRTETTMPSRSLYSIIEELTPSSSNSSRESKARIEELQRSQASPTRTSISPLRLDTEEDDYEDDVMTESTRGNYVSSPEVVVHQPMHMVSFPMLTTVGQKNSQPSPSTPKIVLRRTSNLLHIALDHPSIEFQIELDRSSDRLDLTQRSVPSATTSSFTGHVTDVGAFISSGPSSTDVSYPTHSENSQDNAPCDECDDAPTRSRSDALTSAEPSSSDFDRLEKDEENVSGPETRNREVQTESSFTLNRVKSSQSKLSLVKTATTRPVSEERESVHRRRLTVKPSGDVHSRPESGEGRQSLPVERGSSCSSYKSEPSEAKDVHLLLQGGDQEPSPPLVAKAYDVYSEVEDGPQSSYREKMEELMNSPAKNKKKPLTIFTPYLMNQGSDSGQQVSGCSGVSQRMGPLAGEQRRHSMSYYYENLSDTSPEPTEIPDSEQTGCSLYKLFRFLYNMLARCCFWKSKNRRRQF